MYCNVQKKCLHTRTQIINCRTLLDDERLNELDSALTEKGIDICALQETRRDGFFCVPTDNYSVYTFGECSGSRGVGFAIHNRLAHPTAARGVSNTHGRIMLVDVLLYNATHPATIICAYSPANYSLPAKRNKFYTQLAKVYCDRYPNLHRILLLIYICLSYLVQMAQQYSW